MVISNDYWREGVAGATAGVVGTTLGYPLDAIKTNMQTSQKGLCFVVRNIYEKDGITGFYRGVSAPLVALTILNTLNFSSYATFRKALEAQSLEDSGKSFEWKFAIAGTLAGPLAAVVSTPFEMVKTHQQLRRGLASSQGSLQTTRHLLATHGISSLFMGHMVNTTREVVFLSTYFTVYEHMRHWISSSLPANFAIPAAGGLAGALGWLVSFPLDNIKSNIQGTSIQPDGRVVQKSSLQVFRGILAKKGFLGLYTGVTPSILRAFIVSASRFTAYELAMQSMDRIYVQE